MNPVYLRVALYILSPLIGSIPAIAMSWFTLSVADGWIHISMQVEGAITTAFTALGMSGGILAKWGKR